MTSGRAFARAARSLALLALWASGAGAAGFPFSLHPERARYLLGEPVYLRIDGARDRPPALEEGTVALCIRDPGGTDRVYRPPLRYRAGAGSAGPAASRYARLIAEDGGWVFPKPGRYVLRLRAPAAPAGPSAGDERTSPGISREAEPLSDSLALLIVPPEAAADRRAFARIAAAPGEYAWAVYLEGGDQFREGMAIVRDLASFPNAYAPTAAFVLCSDWSQDYLARGGGRPRPLDLARALAWAGREGSAGTYLSLRTLFRLRNAIALQAGRNPADPALDAARRRVRALEASLAPADRALLASF